MRSIGVSNFNRHQCERIMKECNIIPAVNQIEVNPYFANNEDVQWCQDNGIVVTGYSPFGSPDRPWFVLIGLFTYVTEDFGDIYFI